MTGTSGQEEQATQVEGGAISESALRAAGVLKLEALAIEISGDLEARGIPSILLKGPSIARWLYPPHSRLFGDIDLLVQEPLLSVVEERLNGLGFRHAPLDDVEGDRPWHAHSWVRESDGGAIDLHRTLIGVGAPTTEVWELLSGRTIEMPLTTGSIRVLDEPARLFHIALHAAQDGAKRDHVRLDLAKALDVGTLEQWRSALDIAERLQAREAFGAGLRLNKEGARLASSLGLSDAEMTEVRLRASGAPQSALTLDWIARAPGIAEKVRLIRRKLLPPREFIEAWDPRARAGGIHLIGAYGRRLLFVIRTLPSASVTYWKARRRAR